MMAFGKVLAQERPYAVMILFSEWGNVCFVGDEKAIDRVNWVKLLEVLISIAFTGVIAG